MVQAPDNRAAPQARPKPHPPGREWAKIRLVAFDPDPEVTREHYARTIEDIEREDAEGQTGFVRYAWNLVQRRSSHQGNDIAKAVFLSNVHTKPK